MSGATIELRPAGPADLDAVVAVFHGCWSTSYAAVLPAELVARMTPDRSRSLWTRVLADAAPGEVVVAVAGGTVAGVTRWSVADAASTGWVHSLYVNPTAQGHGIGRRLLTAAEQAIGSAGATTGRLWVFAANEPSLSFYSRSGWSADGTTRVEDEFGEPELGMTKALPAR